MPILSFEEFVKMMALVVQKQDPVEGVLECIREKYDPEETGLCTKGDVIEFLEENDFLGGSKEYMKELIFKFDLKGDTFREKEELKRKVDY